MGRGTENRYGTERELVRGSGVVDVFLGGSSFASPNKTFIANCAFRAIWSLELPQLLLYFLSKPAIFMKRIFRTASTHGN